jgi:hypothetical protein
MFTPKISITGIPLVATELTITDITGVSPTDATGYGQAAYLPASNAIWTKTTDIQYLGTAPIAAAFDPTSDKTAVAGTIPYAMADGVYLVTQYWARPITQADLDYTYAAGVMTKVGATPWLDPLGLLEGVYAIGLDAEDLDTAGILSSLTDTTVSISIDPGTAVANKFLFYRIKQYVLIVNAGTAMLHSKIGDLVPQSLLGRSCDSDLTDTLFEEVLLKSTAQINFNCGNYAKAHNAAILLAEITQSGTTNCQGCV